MEVSNSPDPDAFLARLAQTDDLAPIGTGRRAPIAVSFGGKVYDGMAEVPIEELALCSLSDFGALSPAQRSHRSRRLRKAAKDGTLSVARLEALQARGVLPADLKA